MRHNLDLKIMAGVTETQGKPDFFKCNVCAEVRDYFFRRHASNSEMVPVAVEPQGWVQQQSGDNFASAFQAEQARLLYDGLPAALITNTLLALILASVLWPVADMSKLFIWLVMITVILLARVSLAAAWHRAGSYCADLPQFMAQIWLRRFRVATVATGLVWGAGAVLLFPSGDALHQVFLAFVMAGVSVGAVTLLAVDRVSVFGFLILMLLPLAVDFGMDGGQVSLAMDAMIVLYLIFVVVSSARVASSFHENVRLRIEAVERERVLRIRNDVVTARAALEVDVRCAMQKNQILLHYQPQVDQHGRMTGAEALVRWQHPERGMVMPGDFISLAEETGLILPLGLWVLETACAQLAAWSTRADTAHLTLSVNVSARQLLHPNFVEQVLSALGASGANPEQLKLELTESLLLDNVDDTIDKMTALKSRGIGFSLDDFGTGYSSLSYLKRLPLDQLKIDRSFVRDVLTDPKDAAIARTIVALAHSLGLTVIAEGVESAEQRDLLAHYGCHTYQGYLFSKPLPADQLDAYVLGEGRC